MILLSFLQLLIGIFVLGILVLIHEFGHFLAAKSFGIRVISFSIGFGKPLFSREFRGTEYRISAIPFGGFVHMAGEHPEDAKENRPDEFQTKPVWQRAVVALAGPIANYLGAVATLWLLLVVPQRVSEYETNLRVGAVADSSAAQVAGIQVGDSVVSVNGRAVRTWSRLADRFGSLANRYTVVVVRDGARKTFVLDSLLSGPRGLPRHAAGGMIARIPPIIDSVIPGFPAAQAGLRRGDTVLSIDGLELSTWSAFQQTVSSYDTSSAAPIVLLVGRADTAVELVMRPTADPKDGHPIVGALPWEGPERTVALNVFAAVPAAFVQSADMVVGIYNTLAKLMSREVSPRELSGPVGIVQVSGGAALMGPRVALHLMALLGVNLALLNLLPLVITDGGLLLFLALEALRGRPLGARHQGIINQVAIVFFILLFVYVTFNDVLRIPQMFRLTR